MEDALLETAPTAGSPRGATILDTAQNAMALVSLLVMKTANEHLFAALGVPAPQKKANAFWPCKAILIVAEIMEQERRIRVNTLVNAVRRTGAASRPPEVIAEYQPTVKSMVSARCGTRGATPLRKKTAANLCDAS